MSISLLCWMARSRTCSSASAASPWSTVREGESQEPAVRRLGAGAHVCGHALEEVRGSRVSAAAGSTKRIIETQDLLGFGEAQPGPSRQSLEMLAAQHHIAELELRDERPVNAGLLGELPLGLTGKGAA
ncbi:MAG TPA: hypothetical protein VGM86_10005 [Thermoanaerobaculia bacterium]|jgi:hypothetical protein